jgi:hypothetical protein
VAITLANGNEKEALTKATKAGVYLALAIKEGLPEGPGLQAVAGLAGCALLLRVIRRDSAEVRKKAKD